MPSEITETKISAVSGCSNELQQLFYLYLIIFKLTLRRRLLQVYFYYIYSFYPYALNIDSWQIRASVAQGYNAARSRRATCADLSGALHLLIDVTSRVFVGYLKLFFYYMKSFLDFENFSFYFSNIYFYFFIACTDNLLLLWHLLRNHSAGKTMKCAKFKRTAAQATARTLNQHWFHWMIAAWKASECIIEL